MVRLFPQELITIDRGKRRGNSSKKQEGVFEAFFWLFNRKELE
jgi:hypothetical protein